MRRKEVIKMAWTDYIFKVKNKRKIGNITIYVEYWQGKKSIIYIYYYESKIGKIYIYKHNENSYMYELFDGFYDSVSTYRNIWKLYNYLESMGFELFTVYFLPRFRKRFIEQYFIEHKSRHTRYELTVNNTISKIVYSKLQAKQGEIIYSREDIIVLSEEERALLAMMGVRFDKLKKEDIKLIADIKNKPINVIK